MTRFHHADPDLLRHVDIVLTDVDDTLTCNGRLAAATLKAMARLTAAGIHVIPVTGGCAGWCDHIVRAWPVAAVIGESGAFRFRLTSEHGLDQHFVRPLATLRAEQQQLLTIADRALQQVPAARLAADQPYRMVDVAVDHAQDMPPLPRAQVATLRDIFHAAGAHAHASSIHVNAWFGNHDKASMASWVLRHDLGLSADEQARRVMFIGDAPNDAPLFQTFPLSVGVANIEPHLPVLAQPPRWLCDASHGAGFVEVAQRLLAVRGGGARA